MRTVTDDVPLLDDLMPWSVRSPRLGRDWVVAPDARSLKARWDTLVRAEGPERERLFRPTRARTPESSVSALPGQPTGTGRFSRESGPCPAPVRFGLGPFDEQWLIPDHRLLDAARPELWRVADEHQLFAVEQPGTAGDGAAGDPGPALLVSAVLPDGRSPAGRSGRIRPLHRRPGGAEPNIAPGLADLLTARYRQEVTAEQILAWAVAAAGPVPGGCGVPLTADPRLWSSGAELGEQLLRIQLRGARGGDRPRLPGGRRPYVRAAVPPRPEALTYDPGEEALLLGTGRISPVPAGAWDFTAGGVRVLDLWFARRTAPAEPGTLEALRPGGWLPEWNSELLELITVLALLAGLRCDQRELRRELASGPRIGRAELEAAGVLPVPAAARLPASVLDHHEEGPEGQFALV
ncbi:type ISP restriction/modification enzyme [Streptomyces sp. A 4/2]|uniref:type ISP restriction/modification enzyme n=1 Tax=Streptomyces sp. A 4/2 TaxID=2934314 RepID=UPI0020245091|nr:type ISP restriction/modification enzyme [Streptomyces sp. A 4/2]